ncbi:glycine-rich RNA-binding protein RZ1C-like isoform X2 [Phragmites australis]|uniref:glycine-rich RNA-binding protein RZ1C-like isoform X2 n=1 Tax=Phragmites australis TaxID=29695 RepID=UPI002D79DDB8|nr:glycine-rich RNA-binding protein RZ1C-like isoform X2 [Phragmites australis]
MAGKEEGRIFVGGLSWETNEGKLEEAFRRFGKVVDAQIMLERHTNRHRGFGFVTFEDRRAVDSAIKDMHGQELDGRIISVNKAEPKMNTDDTRYDSGGGRGGDYRGGGRGGDYHGGGRGDGPPPGNCFECGRPGHWARDCPSAGGDRPAKFSSKFSSGGSRGGRGDRFSGLDRFGDRYMDDRYDGSRYGYRDQVDSRDRYAGVRDRYANDRYPSGGDHFVADRYGGPDRYAPSGYGRERERSYERDGVRGGGGGGDGYDRSGPRGGGSYDRDGPRGGMGGGYDRDGPRGGVADRYGGRGPARHGGGSYRERPGPYDRPSRGGHFDDRY